MKKIAILILLQTLMTLTSTIAQTYKSQIGMDQYVQMEIRREGNTVYVSKVDIERDTRVHPSLYNETDLEIVDKQLQYNGEEGYWIIPFGNYTPFRLNAPFWVDCTCMDGGSGGCSAMQSSNSWSCYPHGCSCCDMMVTFYLKANNFNGGAVMVKASAVVQQ